MTRIKCKLCNDVLEVAENSNHIITCKCGETAAHCGNRTVVSNDPANVEIIDDYGNPIVKEYVEEKRTLNDLIRELETLIGTYVDLPRAAIMTPITNYDFAAALALLLQIFKTEKQS